MYLLKRFSDFMDNNLNYSLPPVRKAFADLRMSVFLSGSVNQNNRGSPSPGSYDTSILDATCSPDFITKCQ